MGSINVNRNISDIFYRYKMPRLLAKVEGKGNGIKTVIVNMAEIAKALGRPPTYPTKFFGCELGAQTLFDFKNERFIVNGAHESSKLQDLLDGFIRKFVLCPECDNPETDLIVSTKRNTISLGCKACGYHGVLDTKHKLMTFILKNPPNLNPATQGSSLTEGKRSKRIKKTNGEGTNGDSVLVHSDDANESSCADVTINESATNKPNTVEDKDNDETEWAADVSADAVRARMHDLTDGAKNITINGDLEKSEKDRMDEFYKLVERKRDANQLKTATTQKELLAECKRVDIKAKAPLVLAELLLDDNIIDQLKVYRTLFLRFTLDDKKAQKYLLGGLEQVIALHKTTLLDKVPAIFNCLYESDILSESVIVEWAEKVSKKYVSKEMSQEIHDKAAPFVKWLKEADTEESDSGEASDDDLEIEYSDRIPKGGGRAATINKNSMKGMLGAGPTAAIGKDNGNDEDDVDIDAI